VGGIDGLAYLAAIALASVAAFFSIKGMVTLFPGAPTAIIVMAATMEAAKLITAGWLARRWRSTAWVWRLALVGWHQWPPEGVRSKPRPHRSATSP
jgi:hypothetical protein